MAQDFSLRYPLIDGHGNFGSPDPADRPAAPRYTEARLAPLAMELLGEIDEDTVDFGDDLRRPAPASRVVLPARFPNLLVNGGGGIAVGMATNIPPHNLREVIDATLHLIDHPDATRRRPDAVRARAPTSRPARRSSAASGIAECYRTGRGSIRMRAVAEIDEDARGGQRIVVTEVPYQTSVEVIGQKIAELVERPPHRRHPRRPQRVGRRHGAARRRPEARRERAGRAQPALQAHADADELRGEHARARRRRAAAAEPARRR